MKRFDVCRTVNNAPNMWTGFAAGYSCVCRIRSFLNVAKLDNLKTLVSRALSFFVNHALFAFCISLYFLQLTYILPTSVTSVLGMYIRICRDMNCLNPYTLPTTILC